MRREWEDMANSPYQATFEGLHAWGSKAHCYGMFPAYFLSAYVLGVRLDGTAPAQIHPAGRWKEFEVSAGRHDGSWIPV